MTRSGRRQSKIFVLRDFASSVRAGTTAQRAPALRFRSCRMKRLTMARNHHRLRLTVTLDDGCVIGRTSRMYSASAVQKYWA